jgi:hypothetical protein
MPGNVKEFTYLGSKITVDGRSVSDIIGRINQATSAFNKNCKLLTSSNIDTKIRKQLIKTFVWSVFFVEVRLGRLESTAGGR